MTHRICVVTTTRADFGLLKWVMHEIRAAGMELQVMVSGTHLAPEFGMTVKEIEADGLPIASRVDIQLHGDSGVVAAKSMGVAMLGVAPELQRLKPGLILLLGVDHLLDMGRSATNVIGNAMATTVVSKWENKLTPEEAINA